MDKYEILRAVAARMHLPTETATALAQILDHVFQTMYAVSDVPDKQLREISHNTAALLGWHARVHAAVLQIDAKAIPEIESLPPGLPEVVITLVVSHRFKNIAASSFPWILGIEWYADETEHQFTGEVLARADTPEQLERHLQGLIRLAHDTARTPRPDNVHDTNISRAITTGECWLHMTKVSDLKAKPKTMFDAPTVESITAEPEPVDLQDSEEASRFGGTEKFFNIHGEVRESLPEVWALQAGVY